MLLVEAGPMRSSSPVASGVGALLAGALIPSWSAVQNPLACDVMRLGTRAVVVRR